ncbi:putative aminoadipate reductase [Mycena amicta]|nr:putative aminoadipate reductase [Mycena amicta]
MSDTTNNSIVLPPLDGSLRVNEIIDFHLTHRNLTPMFSFANEDDILTNISHFEYARAAHRVAHMVRPQRVGPEGQVIAIMALTDSFLYQTLVAGCIVAGFVPFPLSHRNSELALIHLLETTNVHRILTTRGSLVQSIDSLTGQRSTWDLSLEDIPTLAQMYPLLGRETSQDAFTPYPQPTDKPSLEEPAFYLHSSGSTGLPKPIPLSHRSIISFAALETYTQIVELAPRLAVGALPPFHAMGIFTQFMCPIFLGLTACLYPPASTIDEHRVPGNATSENSLENAKKVGASGLVAVPSFLLDWAQREEDVEYLKSLNIVPFAGGSLATHVGDFLVGKGVNLVGIYGGTEFGAGTIIRPAVAGDWDWMQFSDQVGVRWDPVGDETFECQFLTVPTHQPAVENLPDVKGYATKDLFERHPTKPHLYRIIGRLDDVIIMANGEKTVPGPMEDILNTSPYISCAVMFGRERNQVGVLIEPAPAHMPVADLNFQDDKHLGQFRNLVWSAVEKANVVAPAFAKLYKEMILVATSARPMVRAPKGTVEKKATIALYEADIAALYATIEASGNAANDVAPPVSWTAEDIEPWLITHAGLLSGKEIVASKDLFDQGFDSLSAMFLRHRIVAVLQTDVDKAKALRIPQNLVYAHPSIRSLAAALEGFVAGKAGWDTDPKALVEAMIAQYSEGLDVAPQLEPRVVSNGGAIILLTGSTGGLGSHILDILLRLSSVERVCAFNRSSRTPLSQRQQAVFRDRALDVALLSSSKLIYLEGDSAQEDFGLSDEAFAALKKTVTVIIHNAWVVDFNKSLSTFEPLVRGTRNLIDFARSSRARFLFTSSIASAQGWDPSAKGLFPEELQLDAGLAVGNGYGESKYVAERMFAASNLPATSFRIGQISGSQSNGAWSTTDWVPALVKSSITLGNFPSDPTGTIAWLPSEAVAQAIVDVALTEEEQPFAVNLVHPRPVAWDAIMGAMAKVAQLPLVPITEWVAQVDRLGKNPSAEDMEQIPAIKLLDLLKSAIGDTGSVQFSTVHAQRVSETIASLPSLSEEDAKRWMGYWNSSGFIHISNSFPQK